MVSFFDLKGFVASKVYHSLFKWTVFQSDSIFTVIKSY